ncbi:hypothetical protein [Aliirhizobium cellulosilyticum]|uniref:Uncharacterized protein n=1 Tax=Aliirhizobium cellulosilyticum TaxID=393664 RepID=A0A7W6Y1I6_9HYPH|nr:hypothetical protein [Rhizobium cellulosilyticum]MBB4349461.1 hypothetical protein [Rhizobium cellulosilyticum]MBB4412317.1 hypothetical protein [Rhizobium cellulosilyticum]MBB4446948.1 hypothetical protein [Rhizobium cellulosilyticum]
MSDTSTKTITATFSTREAADLAVEHLVQKLGIDRADIFVQTSGSENSSGTDISGGDAATVDGDARGDGALSSNIEVSADVAADQEESVQAAFNELGATDVVTS